MWPAFGSQAATNPKTPAGSIAERESWLQTSEAPFICLNSLIQNQEKPS
jgi:hypothetical protein